MRRIAGLLRVFSLPYLRAHPLRVLLASVGVALGVATFVGVQIVAAGLLATFRATVQTVAGESELEVSGLGGTLPESAVAAAAGVPGVGAAAGLVEAFLPLPGPGDESAYLLGIDFLGSPVWRAQFPRDAIEIPDELAFVARVDSVVVPRAFAARRGIALDDPIEVTTPSGRRTLRVRGLMADVPASRLFGGAVLVMDLPAALRLLGRQTIDRVLVDVADDADPTATRQALERGLGAGVEVAPPAERGAQVDTLLASLRAMLETASFTAGIVGGFVVFHAVAASIRQRRRQLALAHVLGTSPRLLVAVCVVETLGIAVVGIAAGLGLGRWLAAAVGDVVGAAAADIWVRVDAVHGQMGLATVLPALAIGLAATLVATAAALRLVLGVSTVDALRADDVSPDDRPVRLKSVLVGGTLVAATMALGLVPPGRREGEIVFASDVVNLLAIGGAALLAPAVVVALGSALNRLARRSRRLPLRLAAAGVPRRPSSGGATVATIVAATSVTVTLAILVASFQGAWVDWLEQHFGADLFVGSGGRVRLMAGPSMDPAIGDALAAVPGIAAIEPFHVQQIRLGGQPIFLQAVALAERLAHGGFAMVEGTVPVDAMEAGEAVLVSDNLAYRLGLRVGDRLALPTPAGLRDVRIGGTYTDFLGSLDLGAVVVSSTFFRRLWNDRSANLYRVWLVPGAHLEAVRAAVTARLPPDAGYYVLGGHEFVDAISGVLRTFFAAGWALQLVAALAGVIGIVNTQVVSVLDRSRELATLRTIGISPRAIGRSVLIECGALGASGGLFGTLLGLLIALELMWFTMRLLTGWRIPIQVPVGQLAFGVLAATTVAAIAGAVPARVARRMSGGSRSID